jgi:hypothetical protein
MTLLLIKVSTVNRLEDQISSSLIMEGKRWWAYR